MFGAFAKCTTRLQSRLYHMGYNLQLAPLGGLCHLHTISLLLLQYRADNDLCTIKKSTPGVGKSFLIQTMLEYKKQFAKYSTVLYMKSFLWWRLCIRVYEYERCVHRQNPKNDKYSMSAPGLIIQYNWIEVLFLKKMTGRYDIFGGVVVMVVVVMMPVACYQNRCSID